MSEFRSLSLCRRWETLVVLIGLALAVMVGAQPARAQVRALPAVWMQQFPATSPSARDQVSMAYDARTGQVVLFGGVDNGGKFLNETWTWNGTNWTQRHPATSPPGRADARMAYDAKTGQVVLFGGDIINSSLKTVTFGDTWIWNGTTWTQQHPATSPPARAAEMMAYDDQTGNVVLFGGADSTNNYFNDTWTWDGTTWTLQNPVTSPSARGASGMVYDAQTRHVVLFGGYGAGFLNDTWTWDGTTWTQQHPATSPPGRDYPEMAYGPQAGKIALFGGSGLSTSGVFNDTWTWDGTTWTQQFPATSPPTIDLTTMVYDAQTGRMVFFGGYDYFASNNGTDGLVNETWTLQLGRVNLGTANVCPAGTTTPAPCSQSASLNFDVAAGTTIGSIKILTEGKAGLDFKATSPDSSTTLCKAQPYASQTTCTVDVTFAPRRPGLRKGAVVIEDGSGKPLATTYVYGTGSGPEAALRPGTISTLAGDGTGSYSGDGGPATSAELDFPEGMAVDGAGDLYIADERNNRIREVNAATGTISTVAGNGTGGYSGDGGAATSAELNHPFDVAVDGAGNLYIADQLNNRIREVNAATGIITTVAGDGTGGYSGDGGTATSGEVNHPYGLAVDGAGNLYIADSFNERIREVNASTGIITTVAGNGTAGYSGDGGPATSAELSLPVRVVEGGGNLYIADEGNSRIREVNASTGIITTVAGDGTQGFSGDGGPATNAELDLPAGVVMDGGGNLYIADAGNDRIREVNAATNVITTVAGNGSLGHSGDGGAATSAELNTPEGVAVDGAGNLYIADTYNSRVRKVDVAMPPSLTFASTNYLSTSTDSPQEVTVENIGNATLTFPIPTTAGAYNPSVSTNFTYDNSSTCLQNGAGAATAFTLASDASCTVAINFTPQTTGTITGNAVLTDDSLNAASPNYTTQSISLSGTATQAPATVTLSNLSQTYTGSPLPVTVTTSPSGLNVSVTYNGSTTVPTNAGSYAVVATVTDPNYTGSATGTLTITKAASAVSLTSSAKNANLNAPVIFTATVTSQTSGTPTGSVEFLDGSTVLGTSPLNNNGVATYTTSTLTAGLHQITAVYQGDVNFNGSTSAPLAQIVTAPAFSLMSSTTNLWLKAGQTGKVTISMVPVGGFTGNVYFTCSGLPTWSRCTFSPTGLSADGSNTTKSSTLTILTNGPNSGTVALMTHPPTQPDGVMLAGIFWLPGLLFGGFLMWQRKRLMVKYRVLILLLLVATTLSGMVGCGFQQPMTGPGISTVTVTGTSGSTTHTLTLYVKVTQ